MHIVIADDLTGAAEIAGVGLSRGLRGMVSTAISPENNIDLYCFATDTRSYAKEDIRHWIIDYTTALKALKPRIFYKKIDSTFRGNVMQECEAFAKAQGLDKVLILPANPSLNRIVKDGTYFINDVPLAEVSYFRRKTSSRLLDLINPAYQHQTKVIKELSELNGPGYYIGEVENYGDLLKWASLSNEPVALCGGSDFFDALLQFNGYEQEDKAQPEIGFGERHLIILGSANQDKDISINRFSDRRFAVSNMPRKIFTDAAFSPEETGLWVREILALYQTADRVVLTMHYPDLPFEERPHLKIALGELIHRLLEQISIDELFVEGGATSYAILKRLEADRLIPVQQLARGVTRMELDRYESLKMTVKPGSYKWPETIWPEVKKMILK